MTDDQRSALIRVIQWAWSVGTPDDIGDDIATLSRLVPLDALAPEDWIEMAFNEAINAMGEK